MWRVAYILVPNAQVSWRKPQHMEVMELHNKSQTSTWGPHPFDNSSLLTWGLKWSSNPFHTEEGGIIIPRAPAHPPHNFHPSMRVAAWPVRRTERFPYPGLRRTDVALIRRERAGWGGESPSAHPSQPHLSSLFIRIPALLGLWPSELAAWQPLQLSLCASPPWFVQLLGGEYSTATPTWLHLAGLCDTWNLWAFYLFIFFLRL